MSRPSGTVALPASGRHYRAPVATSPLRQFFWQQRADRGAIGTGGQLFGFGDRQVDLQQPTILIGLLAADHLQLVQARAQVGANTIVNTRASVDHDSQLGDHAHIAPGATCSGGVRIGDNAHVGVGAVIIEDIDIGKAATIGAGAVVISDCPAGTTVTGIPARPRPASGPDADRSR